MFLVRKISRAKWHFAEGTDIGELSADAITADLRTNSNTLSFWKCGNGSDAEIEEAVLALAAAGNRVDTMDVVWVPAEFLHASGLTLLDTEGRTLIPELARQHTDIRCLNYRGLGTVAMSIVVALKESRYRRYNTRTLKRILRRAVDDKRVNSVDLTKAPFDQL